MFDISITSLTSQFPIFWSKELAPINILERLVRYAKFGVKVSTSGPFKFEQPQKAFSIDDHCCSPHFSTLNILSLSPELLK